MKERLSAVMDGDPAMDRPDDVLARLGTDSELRECWQTYCLIGDAMRGERVDAEGFVSRVMGALDDHPTVLAPVRRRTLEKGLLPQRLLPLAASVMGVAAVGWIATSIGTSDKASEPRAVQAVAQVASPLPVRNSATVAAVDPHREYVFVHQASSRNSPLPGVAQYVRSVSEVQGGGR